ncbi:MAG: hypothetical protein ACYCZY_02695 [Lacisediminihabitans sp.]
MSDETPTPAKTPRTPTAPVDVPADATEVPEGTVVVAPAETSATEPVVATIDPAAVETTVEPAAPAVQTVYVHAPIRPKKRGNRAIGALLALLASIIFAAAYAGVALVVMPLLAPPGAVGFVFMSFVASSVFFVPIAVFAVSFILIALIANRANWWAYVLGSFLVAVVVYFASIGILLLLNGVIALTPNEAARAFRDAAVSPLLIAAALVAREVAMWVGAVIAARGRRVKARNAEAKADFDRESAEKKAEYERAVAGGAAS